MSSPRVEPSIDAVRHVFRQEGQIPGDVKTFLANLHVVVICATHQKKKPGRLPKSSLGAPKWASRHRCWMKPAFCEKPFRVRTRPCSWRNRSMSSCAHPSSGR
eukprot:695769-Alexandrium_andersonii.AAC.1